jgi:hypothetical protein
MILEQTVERTTFAAGEVSPALRWRRDLAEHQAGVEKLENLVVLAAGGATRRPGTRFLLTLASEAEKAGTIPFELDKIDAYTIVVNGGKARFLREGGYIQATSGSPFEIDVPWASADAGLLRSAQDGNVVTIACAGYRPKVLTRIEHLNWRLDDYPVTPVDIQNLDTGMTIVADQVSGAVNLTANTPNTFAATDVGTVWRLDEPSLAAVPQWTSGETGIGANAQRRYNGNVYRAVSGTDAGVNPPTHEEGQVLSGSGKVLWEFLHKGFGFVRIDSFTSSQQVGGTVLSRLPDSVNGTPTYRWWPAAWSDAKGWPQIVVRKQGRLVFFRDDRHWMTRPYEPTSFEVAGADDDAIIGRIRRDDGSLAFVEWALSSGALVAGTRSGEWIYGTSGDDNGLTAASLDPFEDGSEGSAPHVPAIVDGGAVFIGRSRERLHFMKFSREATALDIEEITIAADHILAGKAIAVVYQRDPHRLIWTCTEDGALIAFTFLPKNRVIAAHRHPMANCAVEHLAVMPSADGSRVELILFTRRVVNGATRRFIEILQPFFKPRDRAAPTAAGAWFVDCGLGYQGPPVTTVSGAGHLEGREVAIHADGAMRARQIVTGGAVTLDAPASEIVIGEPIAWRLRSLPIELDTPKGSSKGSMKQVKHVTVDMVETGGGTVATNDGGAEKLILTGAGYGGPVKLQTLSRTLTLQSPTAEAAIVELAGDDTMPATIAGFAPQITAPGS